MAHLMARAQRYSVTAPFRYRHAGSRDWNGGTIVNVSRSGVLFAAETAIAPGRVIEIWFSLPPLQAGSYGAEVVASGFVVRADDAANPPQLAARFHHYTLSRSASGFDFSS